MNLSNKNAVFYFALLAAALLVEINLMPPVASANVLSSLMLQPSGAIISPSVILQTGAVGTSTIYTNNTSAKASVAAINWLSGWAKRVEISIDSSDVDEPLTDFPLLIYLSNDSSGQNNDDVSFIFDEIGSFHRKIAVTTNDGISQCYVEIEKWDLANERAWLWVRALSISNVSSTKLYLYYDADQADNANYVGDIGSSAAQNVWDNGFKGIWHLSEISGGSGAIIDSTSNDNAGTDYGSPTFNSVGPINSAVGFDGVDDFISIPNSASLQLTSSLTIEAWVTLDTFGSGSDVDVLVRKGEGNPNDYQLAIHDQKLELMIEENDDSGLHGSTNLSATTWYYLAGTWDGSVRNVYLNGSEDGSDYKTGSIIPDTRDIYLGGRSGADLSDGLIDEIRVSNTTRNAAWIRASFESERDHLIDFGPEKRNISDYVDNNTSDVGSPIDTGTHSNFTAQQYGPDSINDVLTETGGATVWLWQEDTSGYNPTSSYETYQFWSSWTTNSTTSATVTKIGIYVFANPGNSPQVKLGIYDNNLGSPNNLLGETATATITSAGWLDLDIVGSGVDISPNTTYHIAHITNIAPTTQWRYIKTATPVSRYRNNRVWSILFDPAGTTTASASSRYGAYRVGYDEPYGLDLEVQWTNADYSEMNEELAIYVNKDNTHSLDATGGYMIIGDGSPDWGSTAGTISFWIKMDTSVQGRLWGQDGNMETRWSGTNLVLDWGASDSMISAYSFSADTWYFVAIVWDENSNNLFLYVGDESTPPALDSNSLTGTWTGTTPVPTENRFMNGLGGNEPLDGHGDELRYWNVARNLAQLQSDYDTELTGSETNLRSYFKLNNNLDDIGPNNNDGTGSGSYSFSADVPSSEKLLVDVWNATSWQPLLADLTNGWNNVSISSYLNSSTFTIRFKGGSEASDTNQDSWNIDVTLLHTWTYDANYDYVLCTNNTVTDSWQIRLKKYSESSIDRLYNCTIYFRNSTGGVSNQIIIEDGSFSQTEGPWYDLQSLEGIFIAMTVQARGLGTSDILAYLEVRIPNTAIYAQYVIEFEIT